MLERRQVDAVFEILDAGTHVIRLNNIPQVIVAAVTPYRLPIRIGVRKDWPQLAAILDKALDGIPPRPRRISITAGSTSSARRKSPGTCSGK